MFDQRFHLFPFWKFQKDISVLEIPFFRIFQIFSKFYFFVLLRKFFYQFWIRTKVIFLRRSDQQTEKIISKQSQSLEKKRIWRNQKYHYGAHVLWLLIENAEKNTLTRENSNFSGEKWRRNDFRVNAWYFLEIFWTWKIQTMTDSVRMEPTSYDYVTKDVCKKWSSDGKSDILGQFVDLQKNQGKGEVGKNSPLLKARTIVHELIWRCLGQLWVQSDMLPTLVRWSKILSSNQMKLYWFRKA